MTQRLRWQLVVAILSLILLAGLLTDLVHTYRAGVVPRQGGVYTEGLVGRVQVVNPLLWQTDAEHDLVSLIFSGLTHIDEHGQPVPDLAESWSVYDEGLTYVFSLRENARWHDGTRVTAGDVVFTTGLLQNPDFDARPELSALWSQVKVEKLDERTIRFSLPEPLSPFLDYTALPLLPVHILGGIGIEQLKAHAFNQTPVGSGPFQLKELDAEQAMLTAFKDFYGPKPVLEQINFRFYSGVQSLFTAYENGDIQGMSRVPAWALSAVATDAPDLRIYTSRQASCVAVFLNLDRPVFQDRLVRQALLWSLDRQGLIDQVLDGQGVVAHSPIFPGSWAYTPEIPRIGYHPDRAQALLETAGWADSDGDGILDQGKMHLEFELLTNTDPTRQALAQRISAQWAAIGVQAHVRYVPISMLRSEHLRSRNFDALLYGWDLLTADPDPYPLWHSSQVEGGQNYGGFDHREVDDLLATARQTTDSAGRRRLYRRFQKIFADEVPALLLYQPVYHYGVDARVRNVQLAETLISPSDRFQTLYRWYLDTGRVLQPVARIAAIHLDSMHKAW